MGLEVQVLTSVGKIDPVLYPLARGVHVHRIVRTWGVRGLAEVLRSIRALRPDVLIIQYAPHAFHQRGMTFAVSLVPLILRVITRTRVITNFHELFIPFDRSLKHCLGALWQRAMAFLIALSSHALTAVSSEWPRRLRRVGVWKPIQVIPVGSNIPRAHASAEELQCVRGKLGVNRNALLIGCFGSAGSHRDIQILATAARKVRGEQSLKLVWLGKSGLSAHPVRGAHETAGRGEGSGDIVWTGPLPHPQVSRTMAACDLFVLPFTDGISTKRGTLVAALLHGLPVLTTRGERLDPMFVHGENVYLAPLGDEQAFSDALLELAQSPKLRSRLATGARALHDARLAWDVIAQQVARSAEQASK